MYDQDKQKRLKGDKNLLNFNSASHVSDIYNDRLPTSKERHLFRKEEETVCSIKF